MALNEKRVAEMETALSDCSKAVETLSAGLERMDELEPRMTALFRYYGSEDWYSDREEWDRAEKTQLPEGFGAGVLSEDAVYDLITTSRDAAFHMLELATSILRDRI